MIKYITGNLLESQSDIIGHGVNTKGAFGSGIAGQIRKKWPRVYSTYMEKFQLEGWELGQVQFYYSHFDLSKPIIANMATQVAYGNDGKLYADYIAIKNCLRKVFNFAKYKKYSVAIPRLGCGLAGGDWNEVKPIIEDISKECGRVSIEVYSL